MGSDGDLTIRYTFPSFTQFQITIPQAEGYTLDESQNPVPGEAEQGESYTFRYIKNTENDSSRGDDDSGVFNAGSGGEADPRAVWQVTGRRG